MKTLTVTILTFLLMCSTDKVEQYMSEYNSELQDKSPSRILTNKNDLEFVQTYLEEGSKLNNFSVLNVLQRNDSTNIFESENYFVSITTKDFKCFKNDIDYVGDSILKINNQIKFGTFFKLPNSELASIEIKYKGKVIKFPKKLWGNFYNTYLNCVDNGDYCGSSAFTSSNGEKLFLFIEGGDGKSYYNSVWIFNKGIYSNHCIYSP